MKTPLLADRRFRALGLAERGAYCSLRDEADAAGEYHPVGRFGLWDGVAQTLGCDPEEARRHVEGLATIGVVRLEADRLVLLVGTGHGPRGGQPKAALMRQLRAGRRAGGNETGNENGNRTGNENGNTLGNETGNTVPADHSESPVIVGESNRSQTGNGPTTGGEAPSLPPAPSPPSSHSIPLSSTSLSLPAPAGGGGAGAPPTPEVPNEKQFALQPDDRKADAKAPGKPAKARKAGEAPPMPFLVGEALDALARAAAGRFAAWEGRDITSVVAIQITAHIRRYPTLVEWETVGAWLADGAEAHRGTLGVAWVASAGFRDAMARARDWHAKGRPPADARALTPRRPVGPLPPAPRESWVGATGKASNPLSDPAIAALVNHGR